MCIFFFSPLLYLFTIHSVNISSGHSAVTNFIRFRYDDAGLASHNSALSCDWLLAENATSDASSCLRTEDYIADESGWTGKEKSLLDRGIEIFGKSHVRLSQFIGSKTAAEVKHYLKNFGGDGVFYPVNVGDGTGVAGDSIVLNDSDVSAYILIFYVVRHSYFLLMTLGCTVSLGTPLTVFYCKVILINSMSGVPGFI